MPDLPSVLGQAADAAPPVSPDLVARSVRRGEQIRRRRVVVRSAAAVAVVAIGAVATAVWWSPADEAVDPGPANGSGESTSAPPTGTPEPTTTIEAAMAAALAPYGEVDAVRVEQQVPGWTSASARLAIDGTTARVVGTVAAEGARTFFLGGLDPQQPGCSGLLAGYTCEERADGSRVVSGQAVVGVLRADGTGVTVGVDDAAAGAAPLSLADLIDVADDPAWLSVELPE